MIVLTWAVLVGAASLSGMIAYFSLFGLKEMFSATALEVLILGGILEFLKFTMGSWVHATWTYLSLFRKFFLCFAIFILMFITGLGTYGYLSRGHIETKTDIAGRNAPAIARLDGQISRLDFLKQDAEKQILAIDKSLSEMKGKSSLNERRRQQKNRTKLAKEQQEYSLELIKLTQEKTNLSVAQQKIENKLGPLQYIANAIPGVSLDPEALYRVFILLLMSVGDPLAIVLTISCTHYLIKRSEEKKPIQGFSVKASNGKGHQTSNSSIDIDKLLKSNTVIDALDLTKVKWK